MMRARTDTGGGDVCHARRPSLRPFLDAVPPARTMANLGRVRQCSVLTRRISFNDPPVRASKGRTGIWLILPVVICLSQRLSHACLSTNFYTVKPRMAH